MRYIPCKSRGAARVDLPRPQRKCHGEESIQGARLLLKHWHTPYNDTTRTLHTLQHRLSGAFTSCHPKIHRLHDMKAHVMCMLHVIVLLLSHRMPPSPVSAKLRVFGVLRSRYLKRTATKGGRKRPLAALQWAWKMTHVPWLFPDPCNIAK